MATVNAVTGLPLHEPDPKLSPVLSQNHEDEKRGSQSQGSHDAPNGDGNETDNSTEKQAGVQGIEGITSVWTNKMLWVTFLLLYLVTFIDMLLSSVQTNLTPYVTSSFARHGLVGTTGIVATIVGGVIKLTIAKIIDIWGRLEGLLAMLFLITIGMIMKALCQNVETYAAAHVFYWVGHLGYLYVIDIVIADMTTLKNRMIMLGINTTPTIATTFAGPAIAQLFYERSHFRWAFGAFAIILIGFSLPVIIIFYLNNRKARRLGQLTKRVSNRTWWESVKFHFVEFDVVGMVLTTAGFALLLLPFSLARYFPGGWAHAGPIVMIVIGVLCLAAFGIWEKFYARRAYLPFKYLKDRTVLGASLNYGLMFASVFCWDTYYLSYLQVVHFQNISHAGYILNSFSLTSAFIAPFAGIMIRYFGTFKWPSIAVSLPFGVLGTALLIYFRTPESSVNWLVMCQVFNGISGAVFSSAGQIAVMAAVSHSEIAVVVAIYGLFGSIGAAIGQAIAGAIWNNVLPGVLYDALPEDSKGQAARIFGSIDVQQAYIPGTPVRDAIIVAYADTQRKMVIAGAVFLPFIYLSMLMWRNINLKTLEETRGKQARGNVW